MKFFTRVNKQSWLWERERKNKSELEMSVLSVILCFANLFLAVETRLWNYFISQCTFHVPQSSEISTWWENLRWKKSKGFRNNCINYFTFCSRTVFELPSSIMLYFNTLSNLMRPSLKYYKNRTFNVSNFIQITYNPLCWKLQQFDSF